MTQNLESASQRLADGRGEASQAASTLLDEGIMTDKETAGLLGWHPRTLYRHFLNRTGPPRIAIGRKVFYRRQAVLDWLAANERQQVRARR